MGLLSPPGHSQDSYRKIQDDGQIVNEETEDEGVIRERARVSESMHDIDQVLLIHNVSKTYREKTWYGGTKRQNHAVKNVTLGVSRGEILSLLGPNGAGKSSLLSILNGFIGPSSGQVFIENQDLFHSPYGGALRDIGVCPQNDRLYDKLSVRDHVRIFNGLRGILFDKSEEDRIISDFHLQEHAGKAADTLSGGNKRKLSVALSFIGRPKLILLDEPSTGMDGMVKRVMWNKIAERSRESAIILTTHSMEEAEALSSRIAIMINGSLRAIGTSELLKQKYGSGFRIALSAPSDQADNVREWMDETFVGAKCLNSVGGNMIFEIPRRVVAHSSKETSDLPSTTTRSNRSMEYSLPLLFEIIENNKSKFNIQDYNVGQASLEQVFLSFASQQHS